MSKFKVSAITATIIFTSILTGCSSNTSVSSGSQGGSSSTEESICTKHAAFIDQYESLVGYAGFFASSHLDIWGTNDTMREVGEPEPWEFQPLLKKRVEFVAYSSFAQQCFSAELRQAMLEYVNG